MTSCMPSTECKDNNEKIHFSIPINGFMNHAAVYMVRLGTNHPVLISELTTLKDG